MGKIIGCKIPHTHKKVSKMVSATCTNDTEIKCTSPALYCKICAIKTSHGCLFGQSETEICGHGYQAIFQRTVDCKSL